MRSLDRPAPSTRTPKGFLHASALVGLILVLGATLACQGQGTPTTVPTTASTAATTPSPATASAPTPTATPAGPSAASPGAAFPRTVVDDEGTTLEIETSPTDIVSLTPANTEIVFALGAGDRLRGGTDFDDFPPEAIDLPDVATFTGVLIEKVVDIQPDLVLAGGNNFTPPGDIDRLRDLGIPVLVVYAATVDEVMADIELIGAALGADAEAAQITSAIDSRIAEVVSAVADLDRPRVFYEIGNVPEIFGPAPNSFIADMVVLAGGEVITTNDPAVFSISLEQLVAQDPEVIVLGDAAYDVCPQDLVTRPGWVGITAVRDGQVRPVDDIVVTRPGPRLGEGLAALALAIHPDAAIAPPEGVATYCVTPD
jgi:iron complex transport system substrate-binding protein